MASNMLAIRDPALSLELTEYIMNVNSARTPHGTAQKPHRGTRPRWFFSSRKSRRHRESNLNDGKRKTQKGQKPKVQWETQNLSSLVANLREGRKLKSSERTFQAEAMASKTSDASGSSWYSSSSLDSVAPGVSESDTSKNGLPSLASIEEINSCADSVDSPTVSEGSSVEIWPPRIQRQKQINIPVDSPRVEIATVSTIWTGENSLRSFAGSHLSSVESKRTLATSDRRYFHSHDNAASKKVPDGPRRWSMLLPTRSAKKHVDAVAVGMLNDSFVRYQAAASGGKSGGPRGKNAIL